MVNMSVLFNEIRSFLLEVLVPSVFLKFVVILLKAIACFAKGKDGKVFKYTIISPINDNVFNKDEIKTYFWFIMDLVEIYLVLLIIWLVTYITQKAAFFDLNDGNLGAYFLIVVCMITIILSGIARKTKAVKKAYYKLCCCIIGLLLVNCCELVITSYLLQNYSKIHNIILVMFISCLCDWELVEVIYACIRYGDLPIYKRNKIIRFIRSIGIVFCIVFVFWNAVSATNYQFNQWVYSAFILLWLFLCFLEDFYLVDNPSGGVRVRFTVCLQNNCDQVQSSIYQYEGNKIRYMLDNDHIKIIDCNEIMSIDYTLKNFYGKKKKKVTCFLNNGDVLEFDGYKFIKDSWVSFYKISENVKCVKIINNMRIKEIFSDN